MNIWLDTAELSFVERALRYGLVAGVTTNPTLLAHADKKPLDVVEGLLKVQTGPVTVQVVADEVVEMVQQGLDLFALSDRIIIKVPMSKQGLEAIHALANEDVPTMATALFSPAQALTAALAGATYLAPYVGRIEKEGGNPWEVISRMQRLLEAIPKKVQIVAASLRDIDQVLRCAEIGVDAVTLKEEVFEALIADHPGTLQCITQFHEDWKRIEKSASE